MKNGAAAVGKCPVTGARRRPGPGPGCGGHGRHQLGRAGGSRRFRRDQAGAGICRITRPGKAGETRDVFGSIWNTSRLEDSRGPGRAAARRGSVTLEIRPPPRAANLSRETTPQIETRRSSAGPQRPICPEPGTRARRAPSATRRAGSPAAAPGARDPPGRPAAAAARPEPVERSRL